MLENLRGMAVFASVVDHGSFSGAAKSLGITTSAVSQQIRALEEDLGVILLHRSTRKLNLTEAGQGFYDAAKNVVSAAEEGRMRVNQLRDDLAGTLRIATTPQLGVNHILPAISDWVSGHSELNIDFLADNRYIDMIEERVDLSVRIGSMSLESRLSAHFLADVRQVLVASPGYLDKHDPIQTPKDLPSHLFIGIELMKDGHLLDFIDEQSGKKTRIKMSSRFTTNNVMLATTMALQGYGFVRLMELDAKPYLQSGELVEVLPNYALPSSTLYAATLKKERQPVKVERCLEMLQTYFQSLSQ